MSAEVAPVTSGRWADFDAFFAAAKPDCYCRWPRMEPTTFTPDDTVHRDAMRRLVADGVCPGLLACVDGEPAGWCAVAPLTELPQYAERSDGRWGIACITVAARMRGRGIARRLVDDAVAFAADHGAVSVDGPPPWWKPADGAERDALLLILRDAGFEQVGDGVRMPVLRRTVRRT